MHSKFLYLIFTKTKEYEAIDYVHLFDDAVFGL